MVRGCAVGAWGDGCCRGSASQAEEEMIADTLWALGILVLSFIALAILKGVG